MKNNINGKKNSIISGVFSVFGFVLVMLGVEGYKYSTQIDGIFWPHLANLLSFFISNPNISSMKATQSFPLTDENVIIVIITIGICLTFAAIYYGFLAKKQNENSLHYASPIVLSFVTIIYATTLLKLVLIF